MKHWFDARSVDPILSEHAIDPSQSRALICHTGRRQPLPTEADDGFTPMEKMEHMGAAYSDGFVERFCDAIADGATMHSLSLRPDMPSRPTLRKWMRDNPAFFHAYQVARRARADARSDRMDEIAAAVENGTLDPLAARVILSHEQWQASKENAGRYGDKLMLDVPPSPQSVAFDRSNPREVERVVMSVFANLNK